MRKIYQYNEKGDFIEMYPSIEATVKTKRIVKKDLLLAIKKRKDILGFYYKLRPPSCRAVRVFEWVANQRDWFFFNDIPERFTLEEVWQFIESNSHIVLNDDWTAFKRIENSLTGRRDVFMKKQREKFEQYML